MFVCRLECIGGGNMSIKQTQNEIRELKDELKATNRANDLRLLKLFVLMILLAAIAALIHGRIDFFSM
jgi:hypothetical protein